jgi:DNA-directed RNA polymerase subunit RPC12/RpoP
MRKRIVKTTLYGCDNCNKEFEDIDDLKNHEKQCNCEHEYGEWFRQNYGTWPENDIYTWRTCKKCGYKQFI